MASLGSTMAELKATELKKENRTIAELWLNYS